MHFRPLLMIGRGGKTVWRGPATLKCEAEPTTIRQALKILAHCQRTSTSAVLRNSVSVNLYLHRAWERGARVVIEEPDGKKTEILPPRGMR